MSENWLELNHRTHDLTVAVKQDIGAELDALRTLVRSPEAQPRLHDRTYADQAIATLRTGITYISGQLAAAQALEVAATEMYRAGVGGNA